MLKKALYFLVVWGLVFQPLSTQAQTLNMRSQKNSVQRTIYYYASKQNLQALQQMKLQGYSVDSVDANQNTALCSAVLDGNAVAAHSLMSMGANTKHNCMQRIPKPYYDRINAQLANLTVQAQPVYTGEPINNLRIPSNSVCTTNEYGLTTCSKVDQSCTQVDELFSDSYVPIEEGLSTGGKIGIGIAAALIVGGGIALAAGGGGGGGGGSSGGGEDGGENPPTPFPTCTTNADCGECEACEDGACVSKTVEITTGTCCDQTVNCCSLTETCDAVCTPDASCGEPPPTPFPTCTTNADCGECEACESGTCVSKTVEIQSGTCCDQTVNCCSLTETCDAVCTPDASCGENPPDPTPTCSTNADCGECEACESGTCVSKSVEIQSGTCCDQTVNCCSLTETCDAVCTPDASCGENPPDPTPACTTNTDCGECEACEDGACVSKTVEIQSGTCCDQTVNCCSLTETCDAVCTPDASCGENPPDPTPTCTTNADCGECEACESGTCVSKTVENQSGTCCDQTVNCCSLTETCDAVCTPNASCGENPPDPTPTCTTNADCGECEACESGTCVSKSVEIQSGTCCDQTVNCCSLTETCDAVCTPDTSCAVPQCSTNADCGECEACEDGACISKSTKILAGACCDTLKNCCSLTESCEASCTPLEACETIECPEGFFLAEDGSCQRCGLGYYSKRGSTICTPCAVGSYANQLGSLACTNCPTGWTTSTKAATSCDICAPSYTKVGNDCVPKCKAGDFWDGTSCTPCPIGSFSQAGATTCTACNPKWSTSTEGSSTCDTCAEGYHFENDTCVSDDVGSTSDPTAQKVCAPGEAPKSGVCTPCEVGYYGINGMQCEKCPTGSTTASTGSSSQSQCNICLDGYTLKNGQCIQTICSDGYYLDNGICRPHCFSGHYWDGTTCQLCPAGSSNYSEGKTQCTKCRKGSYQPNKGQTWCLYCPLGSTTADEGATAISDCNVCSAGYVYDGTQCTACPIGTYHDQSTNTCKPCAAGTYNNSTAQTKCLVCDEGMTSQEGATFCSCDEENGYFAVGKNCVKEPERSCNAGQYWSTLTNSCEICEEGTFSPTGANYCTACPYGYYASKKGSVTCQVCPIGWTTSTNKATSCDICSDGYVMKNGMCVSACGAGSFYNGEECEECPIGSISQAGATSCIACPTGYSTSKDGSYICDACADGYSKNYDDKCVPKNIECRSGQYFDKDTRSCKTCPAGTASSDGKVCKKCSQGTYAPEGAGACTSCPQGSTTEIVGATQKSDCNKCFAGYTWDAESSSCVAECTGGEYWDGSACSVCPSGTYSTSWLGVKTVCSLCMAGTYNSDVGQTACHSCPQNMTSPTGSTSIDDCVCEDGYEENEDGECVAKCIGASFWNGSGCATCGPGSYAITYFQTCRPCAIDSYSLGDTTTCTKCEEGFGTSIEGMDHCDVCNEGYEKNGDTCTACKKGSFAVKNSTCQLCPIGSYSTKEARGSCTECPKGYTTASVGSDAKEACSICDTGYKPLNGECRPLDKACNSGEYWTGSACAACAAGTFAPAGSTRCMLCPKGYYSDGEKQSACTACPEGFTTKGVGSPSSTECSICIDGYELNSEGKCVKVKRSCESGYFYNGFKCVKVPNYAVSDTSDPKGWSCQSGYQRVGEKCIWRCDPTTEKTCYGYGDLITETIENNEDKTSGIELSTGHTLLINNATIDLGENESTSSKTGIAGTTNYVYAINNGTIKGSGGTLIGMDGQLISDIMENNGTIDLTGSALTGMSGPAINYGDIILNGKSEEKDETGKSVYGINAAGLSTNRAKNYGNIKINANNVKTIYGIYGGTYNANNYGNIEITSFEGGGITGIYSSNNYGTLILRDYQNITDTPDGATYGVVFGMNFGHIYIDVQNTEADHFVTGVRGSNYGTIQMYGRNLEKTSWFYGLYNGTNYGNIFITTEKTAVAAGGADSTNRGVIKMQTSDTLDVFGLKCINCGGSLQNYGDIEIVAAGADNVYGMDLFASKTVNFGNIHVTSLGWQTKSTIGVDGDNRGNVYVSASGKKAYGVTGENNDGTITITGSADTVAGMKANYYTLNEGTIDVDASKTSKAYGIMANSSAGPSVTNTGTINILNQGNQNEVAGIYAKGLTLSGSVTNQGNINITNEGSGTAYGIYASYSKVTNRGNITITNSGNGKAYGIFATNNSKVYNSGTITINGSSWSGNEAKDNFIVLKDRSSMTNAGTFTSTGVLTLPTLYTVTASSKTQANESIIGQAKIAADTVAEGFKQSYLLENMFSAPDTSKLSVKSGSALFDATLQDNGKDVLMQMKSFDELTKNKSLAAFLENNYAKQNNEGLFGQLKASETIASFTNALDKLTGHDVISRFAYEDLAAMHSINFAMNEAMFDADPSQQIFETAGSVSTLFRTDSNSSSQYGLITKYISPRVKAGYGVSFTNLNTDDDNDNTRHDTMVQFFAPIGYEAKGIKLISSPRFGYARGHYRRQGLGTSYEGWFEKRIFGVMNEARYPIHLGFMDIEPAIEMNAIGYMQKGREDKKAYSLRIPTSSNISVESGLGLYAKRKFGKLNVTAGLAYYHEFADPNQIKVAMQGMEGSFLLKDSKFTRDRGQASFDFTYDINDLSIYGSLRYFIEKESYANFNTGFRIGF